mmetsp:Transcript_15641/g.34402  ORF Transcript_15641/g.34402 Transcript_15641/m.34402 type:complete len:291 (+) Transcript_15641:982-1854(+)
MPGMEFAPVVRRSDVVEHPDGMALKHLPKVLLKHIAMSNGVEGHRIHLLQGQMLSRKGRVHQIPMAIPFLSVVHGELFIVLLELRSQEGGICEAIEFIQLHGKSCYFGIRHGARSLNFFLQSSGELLIVFLGRWNVCRCTGGAMTRRHRPDAAPLKASTERWVSLLGCFQGHFRCCAAEQQQLRSPIHITLGAAQGDHGVGGRETQDLQRQQLLLKLWSQQLLLILKIEMLVMQHTTKRWGCCHGFGIGDGLPHAFLLHIVGVEKHYQRNAAFSDLWHDRHTMSLRSKDA